MKRDFQKYLFVTVGLVLVILAMVVFSISMLRKPAEVPQQVKAPKDAESTIHLVKEVETISGETIVAGIQEMGELITAEYYCSHEESFESLKKFLMIPVPGTKVNVVYTVDVMINAGIDFSQVSVTVNDLDRTILLAIPAAKILSSEIDYDSFETVRESVGIFAELSAEDVNKTLIHVQEMEEEKAIENGLLTNADENAAKILESFVKSNFDLKDYTVTVEGV